jgi:hypothetical protein
MCCRASCSHPTLETLFRPTFASPFSWLVVFTHAICACRHTYLYTNTYTHTPTHPHTHTPTPTHRCMYTPIYTHSHPFLCLCTLTVKHTFFCKQLQHPDGIVLAWTLLLFGGVFGLLGWAKTTYLVVCFPPSRHHAVCWLCVYSIYCC